MFFAQKKHHPCDHHSPHIPPRTDHQKTTSTTHFSQNPIKKTPIEPENRFDGRL